MNDGGSDANSQYQQSRLITSPTVTRDISHDSCVCNLTKLNARLCIQICTKASNKTNFVRGINIKRLASVQRKARLLRSFKHARSMIFAVSFNSSMPFEPTRFYDTTETFTQL